MDRDWQAPEAARQASPHQAEDQLGPGLVSPGGAAAPRPGPHPGRAGSRLLSAPCGWLEGKPHQAGVPVGVTHGADSQYISVEGMNVSRP